MTASDSSAPFAFVRVSKLRSPSEIAAASRHARGDDVASQKRRRGDATLRAYGATMTPDGEMTTAMIQPREAAGVGTDYRAAFDTYCKTTGARHRRGSPLAMHMIVGVSPNWIDGDPHDPHNPQVQDLVQAAYTWAKRNLGGVWAVRYDVDEQGSGVVDVLCSPTVEYAPGRHRGKPSRWISVATALRKLAARYKRRKSYSALQDSWSEHAAATLDPRIRRGQPKAITGREHLSPEEYGESRDKHQRELAAHERKVSALKAELDGQEQELARQKAEREAAAQEQELRHRQLTQAVEDALQRARMKEAAALQKARAAEDLHKEAKALATRLAAWERDLNERAAVAFETWSDEDVIDVARLPLKRAMEPGLRKIIRAMRHESRRRGFDYRDGSLLPPASDERPHEGRTSRLDLSGAAKPKTAAADIMEAARQRAPKPRRPRMAIRRGGGQDPSPEEVFGRRDGR